MTNKYFQDIKIDIVDETKKQCKIFAEPFDRGYAVTVGNGLRRTLLTSIPGAAVNSVKIDGVSHEFSTIKGVTNDTSEIILNLKKIRFKMNDEASSELISLKFESESSSVLKAGELNSYLSDFTVINKGLKLATINKKITLNMEIRVSRGKGYLTADKNKRTDDSLGTISIDSIFNPVMNVAWDVIPIPSSTEGHEELILKVETDCSTKAKDCINHAAKIITQHLSFFMFSDYFLLIMTF